MSVPAGNTHSYTCPTRISTNRSTHSGLRLQNTNRVTRPSWNASGLPPGAATVDAANTADRESIPSQVTRTVAPSITTSADADALHAITYDAGTPLAGSETGSRYGSGEFPTPGTNGWPS